MATKNDELMNQYRRSESHFSLFLRVLAGAGFTLGLMWATWITLWYLKNNFPLS